MIKFKGMVITAEQVEFLKNIYSIEFKGKVYFPSVPGKSVYDQMVEQGGIEE